MPEWRRALSEIVAALDHRAAELGMTLLERPEPWVMRCLGVPPRELGPLRDDWMARAGTAAVYREQAGISDPQQAVGPAPRCKPELLEAWQASLKALEIEDTYRVRADGTGALEARVREYERAKAWAPQPAARDLELTTQAARDAGEQAVQARAREDERLAGSAEALKAVLDAESARLQAQQAAREDWEQVTAPAREAARDARAELERRGVEPEPELPERNRRRAGGRS